MAKARVQRTPIAKPAVPKASRPSVPSVWTNWTPRSIRNALTAHESGDFFAAALLADQYRRDDRIFATLDTRVLTALGLPWDMVPSEDTARLQDAQRYARQVKAWWFTAIPESVQADVLRQVGVMGFCLAENVWEEQLVPVASSLAIPELRPRLRIHHPQFVRYQYGIDEEGWYIQTQDGPIRVTPGDGRWVLFSHGAERPWMNGALRALAWPWLMRTDGRRDWMRRSEIDGIGVKRARTPPSDQIDQKTLNAFLAQVKNIGSDGTLVLPKDYDFDIHSNTASAAQGFTALLGSAEMAITLALLGANLPTEATGGSFALGEVQAGSTLDRLEADVEMLSTCFREQVIKPWGRFNVEGWADELAPWPRWDPTPPEDRQANAAALLTASQAILNLHELGVEVGPLLEKFGLKASEAGLRAPSGAAPHPAATIQPQQKQPQGPAQQAPR